MKQCVNCKKIIPDNVTVCPECGKNPDVVENAQPAMTPVRNVEPVQTGSFKDQVEAANMVIQQAFGYVDQYNAKMEEAEENAQSALSYGFQIPFLTNLKRNEGYKMAKKKAYKHFWFVVLFMGCFCILNLLALNTSGIIGGILKFVSRAAFLAAAVYSLFYGYKQYFVEPKQMAQHILKKAQEEAQVYLDQADATLRDNYNIVKILPTEYWYPIASDYIAMIARQGRVDNMKEALNMCDEYIHRMNMEAGQQQMLQNQVNTSNQLTNVQWLQILK